MLCRIFVVRILNLYALMAGWQISTEVCVIVGEGEGEMLDLLLYSVLLFNMLFVTTAV